MAGSICEDFAFEVSAPDFALAVLKGLSHVAPHAHSLTLKNVDFSRDAQVAAYRLQTTPPALCPSKKSGAAGSRFRASVTTVCRSAT